MVAAESPQARQAALIATQIQHSHALRYGVKAFDYHHLTFLWSLATRATDKSSRYVCRRLGENGITDDW